MKVRPLGRWQMSFPDALRPSQSLAFRTLPRPSKFCRHRILLLWVHNSHAKIFFLDVCRIVTSLPQPPALKPDVFPESNGTWDKSRHLGVHLKAPCSVDYSNMMNNQLCERWRDVPFTPGLFFKSQ